MTMDRVWTWVSASGRREQGHIVIGPSGGLIIVPEDDFYTGVMDPTEAVELARAILDKFGASKSPADSPPRKTDAGDP